MKRLVLTVTGTAAGLAALLSFKVQTHPIAQSGPLPSAAAAAAANATPEPTGSASASASASPSPTAGSTSYTGRASTNQYGIVQVKATVAGGKITDVAFVQLTAFDHHSEEINGWAAPELLRETLQQQNAQVDTVSGASYTSESYRESLQSALDQAGLR